MNKQSLPQIIEALEKLKEVTGGYSDWIYSLQEANSVWDRSPFKEGDHVALTETPDINYETSWGWMGAKHFLVEGAVAIVNQVEFRKGQFWFYLTFDDETWIDHEGVKQLPTRKAHYCFSERWVEKAP